MFADFAHRQIDCTVDATFHYGQGVTYGQGFTYSGVSDKVILSRETKGRSIIDKEYVYNARFAGVSTAKEGALVQTTNDQYFALTLRMTPDGDKDCSLMKLNVAAEIQRYGQTYDANDNPLGASFNTVQTEVWGYAEYVKNTLKEEKLGLLPTTVYTLLLHSSADIKRPEDVPSPDRVMINGRAYQVDAVDGIKLPNTLFVELSEDHR